MALVALVADFLDFIADFLALVALMADFLDLIITKSTRRFLARPALLPLDAMGRSGPYPLYCKRSATMPLEIR